MKWIKYSTAALTAAFVATAAFGQDQKEQPSKDKEEKTQEIVIRKKGDKKDKMTIVVDGDNVTINGKPVDEFKNDDVTIFKRERPLGMAAPRVGRMDRIRRFDDIGGPGYLTPSANKAFLGIMTQKADNGVKVTEVNKESGAEKAGLKKDDVITKVGKTAITTPQELIEAISAYKPNDKVDITYKRDGKENKTTATLGENKSAPFSFNFDDRDFNFNLPKEPMPPTENFNFNWNTKPRIGLQIQDVEEGKGVKVKDVDDDSPASKAGIKEGDIISQVNGKDVAGVDELRNTIKDLKEGDVVKLTYKRNGKNQTAEIKIPKRLKSADL